MQTEIYHIPEKVPLLLQRSTKPLAPLPKALSDTTVTNNGDLGLTSLTALLFDNRILHDDVRNPGVAAASGVASGADALAATVADDTVAGAGCDRALVDEVGAAIAALVEFDFGIGGCFGALLDLVEENGELDNGGLFAGLFGRSLNGLLHRGGMSWIGWSWLFFWACLDLLTAVIVRESDYFGKFTAMGYYIGSPGDSHQATKESTEIMQVPIT